MMNGNQVSKHRGVSFRVKKDDKVDIGSKELHGNYFDEDTTPSKGKLEVV
jgi:hypothetical protein